MSPSQRIQFSISKLKCAQPEFLSLFGTKRKKIGSILPQLAYRHGFASVGIEQLDFLTY
jgi:hypothetical protein